MAKAPTSTSTKILLVIGGVIVLLAAGVVTFRSTLLAAFFRPTSSSIPSGVSMETAITTAEVENANETTTNSIPTASRIQTVATELNIPWDIAFLPDESLLLTERPGTLVRLYPDTQARIGIQGVAHVGEGGLQGLALDPDFSTNNHLYLYLTTEQNGELSNRVERYTLDLENNLLSNKTVVIENIPGARYHDGGRLEFGPDDLLYITTGDAGFVEAAQDTSSVAGKVLRIARDGSNPSDNPFSNPVYTYGHRNPQGLAWDSSERLWSSEHGPSGAQTGNDEINVLEAGQNYGWPVIKGTQSAQDMVSPVIESGTQETWAPGDVEIIADQLFFTGLRGEALYQATIDDNTLTDMKAHFRGEFGRLRFVRVGPDGWLYMGTSNTDGRGQSEARDDRVIKIHPSVFGL